MKHELAQYCATIGADPLLVQGAGGNASWKDGKTLWVKASGTWLADAATKEIFVPVDLPHLKTAIAQQDFDAKPQVLDGHILRPSIETMLHALMPHKIVLHLHAVDVLARLVRSTGKAEIARLLEGSAAWAWVEYCKPGAALAAAIHAARQQQPNASVIFLANHGMVLGANSVEEVAALLSHTLERLRISDREVYPPVAPASGEVIPGYTRLDPVFSLATTHYDRLAHNWALFPDHVVFLGARPCCYATPAALLADAQTPELAFVRNVGVFAQPAFNETKKVQLECYEQVLRRQNHASPLHQLTLEQIAELLDWDAEKYRQEIAR